MPVTSADHASSQVSQSVLTTGAAGQVSGATWHAVWSVLGGDAPWAGVQTRTLVHTFGSLGGALCAAGCADWRWQLAPWA